MTPQQRYKINHPGAAAAACKRWRERNPEKAKKFNGYSRKRHLKHEYGTDPETVAAIATKQQHRCAICAQVKLLGVDHDHHSGKIRGLLCKSCNLGIGLLGDNEEGLARALEYFRGQS